MATYYVFGDDDRRYGPISTDDIRQWIRENRIDENSRVADSVSGKVMTAREALAIPNVPQSDPYAPRIPSGQSVPSAPASPGPFADGRWKKWFSSTSFLNWLEQGHALGFVVANLLRLVGGVYALVLAAMLIGWLQGMRSPTWFAFFLGALLHTFGSIHVVQILFVRARKVQKQAGSEFPTLGIVAMGIRAYGEATSVLILTLTWAVSLIFLFGGAPIQSRPSYSPYGGYGGYSSGSFMTGNLLLDSMSVFGSLLSVGGGFSAIFLMVWGLFVGVMTLLTSYLLAELMSWLIRVAELLKVSASR